LRTLVTIAAFVAVAGVCGITARFTLGFVAAAPRLTADLTR
jgi:hypothetical protein